MPEMCKFDLTQYDWYKDRIGSHLPCRHRYVRENMDATELWILLDDYTLSIQFSDGTSDVLEYRKGFVWDLASVPSAFRSIIDNDSFMVFIAALFHDASFGLHLYDFETCNDYFQQLIVVTAHQYGKRLLLDSKVTSSRIESIRKKLKYNRKTKKFIHELVKDAERDSKLYEFGVDTKIGRNIYNSSIPCIHWNNELVVITKGAE